MLIQREETMSDETMTLADFLRARVAEDEAVARTAEYGYIERQLAECEAKRRIVEEFTSDPDYTEWPFSGIADTVLCLLALPYADHPDYRDDFAP